MICPLQTVKVPNIPCQGVDAHALSIRVRRRFSRRRKIGTAVCFTADIRDTDDSTVCFCKGLF